MDLRSHILTELALSERIVRKGMEVVPRFTVFAPDGPHTAMVELGDDEQERAKQLLAIRVFMIFKAAHGFLLANKVIEQNAISVIGVTRSEIIGALKRVPRKPMSFGEPEWFGRESIDDAAINLLPPKSLAITKEELEAMELAYGEGGVNGITWLGGNQ